MPNTKTDEVGAVLKEFCPSDELPLGPQTHEAEAMAREIIRLRYTAERYPPDLRDIPNCQHCRGSHEVQFFPLPQVIVLQGQEFTHFGRCPYRNEPIFGGTVAVQA